MINNKINSSCTIIMIIIIIIIIRQIIIIIRQVFETKYFYNPNPFLTLFLHQRMNGWMTRFFMILCMRVVLRWQGQITPVKKNLIVIENSNHDHSCHFDHLCGVSLTYSKKVKVHQTRDS